MNIVFNNMQLKDNKTNVQQQYPKQESSQSGVPQNETPKSEIDSEIDDSSDDQMNFQAEHEINYHSDAETDTEDT